MEKSVLNLNDAEEKLLTLKKFCRKFANDISTIMPCLKDKMHEYVCKIDQHHESITQIRATSDIETLEIMKYAFKIVSFFAERGFIEKGKKFITPQSFITAIRECFPIYVLQYVDFELNSYWIAIKMQENSEENRRIIAKDVILLYRYALACINLIEEKRKAQLLSENNIVMENYCHMDIYVMRIKKLFEVYRVNQYSHIVLDMIDDVYLEAQEIYDIRNKVHNNRQYYAFLLANSQGIINMVINKILSHCENDPDCDKKIKEIFDYITSIVIGTTVSSFTPIVNILINVAINSIKQRRSLKVSETIDTPDLNPSQYVEQVEQLFLEKDKLENKEEKEFN
jgi:hypothetical protein